MQSPLCLHVRQNVQQQNNIRPSSGARFSQFCKCGVACCGIDCEYEMGTKLAVTLPSPSLKTLLP